MTVLTVPHAVCPRPDMLCHVVCCAGAKYKGFAGVCGCGRTEGAETQASDQEGFWQMKATCWCSDAVGSATAFREAAGSDLL